MRGVTAKLPWLRLLPSLGLIAAGIACVNHVETGALRADPEADFGRYALGALLTVGAVACWTWYPLRNADWLRAPPRSPPGAWATAQGVATLPLALAGYLGWSGAGRRPAAVRFADALRPAAGWTSWR
jgi:drug/metabolite transporter (DMT)-like permease